MTIYHYPSIDIARSYLAHNKKHNTVNLVWGRFQPPHKGHMYNFTTANKDPNTDVYIVPSGTCDNLTKTKKSKCTIKNPFPIEKKLEILELLNPNYNYLYMGTSRIENIVSLFTDLGYNQINIIIGKDQEGSFDFLVNTIQGEAKIKFIVLSDEREVISTTQHGMVEVSATKVREALQKGDTLLVKELMGNPKNFEAIAPILQKYIPPLSQKGGFFQHFLLDLSDTL